MTEPHEKRKHPRVELLLKITYDRAEDFLSDYTSNASTGGVFIATDKPFQIGEQIIFDISFPGLVQPIHCRGIVRWRRQPEDADEANPAGIGVAFQFDSPAQMESIRRLLEGNAASGERLVHETDSDQPAFKVLLVEDNKIVRDMVRFAVQKFHRARFAKQRTLEVIEAANGQEGWECIQQQAFSIAIIDMYMPVMDGAELIQRIRRGEHAPHMPVIVISAGGDDARRAAYQAGADFFLGKPVMLAQLFQSLRRLLGIEQENP